MHFTCLIISGYSAFVAQIYIFVDYFNPGVFDGYTLTHQICNDLVIGKMFILKPAIENTFTNP